MSDPKLKISIVTVCLNAIETIQQTINSVQNQDYNYIEHIIVDGGSTDGTLEYLQNLNYHNLKVISESDDGLYDAMNKGYRLASGEIVGILNADDIFADSRVMSRIAREFCAFPKLEVLLTNINFVDFNLPEMPILRHVGINNYSPSFLRFGWMPPHPGVYIKRQTFLSVGFYSLNYKISADYEFLIRLFYKYNPVYKTANVTSVLMRPGGNSTRSIRSNIIITREICRAFKENGLYTNEVFVTQRLLIKPFIQVFPFALRRMLNLLR